MNAAGIADGLDRISSVHDETQLQQLQSLVEAIEPSLVTPALYRALFGVFERFPNDDGHGGFWAILHLLEKCPLYEPFLIESVRRCPVEFNLSMVSRLLNGGFTRIGDVDLVVLLDDVAKNSAASESARACARNYLSYQQQHGQSA